MCANEAETLRGYAFHGSASRLQKAKKIERILSRRLELSNSDMLDLGAGAGLVSAYFAPRVRSIIAADREPDEFEPREIPIVRTPTSSLPFESASFDVIIYNHVIEHVGQRDAQAESLREILRVLRPRGILYLAVPNRWALIEPHFRLPFLSWLPAKLADVWVRKLGKNDWYDCNPFGHRELLTFIRNVGFETEDVTADAFYLVLEIEKSASHSAAVLRRLPRWAVQSACFIMPTFVVLSAKPD